MSYFIKQNAVNQNLHSTRGNKIFYIKHSHKNHKHKIAISISNTEKKLMITL